MLPLVVALALAAPAAPQKWVALVRLSADVPAAWHDALQAAAVQNKQATSWADPPAVTLDEAQLALGCAGWSKACAGQIAGMTGAVAALIVEVTAKDAGATVSVQAVKANGNTIGTEEHLDLASRTDKDLEFAKDFVRSSPKGQRLAYLVVDTDVPGAEVSIDGERKGKTPYQESLPAGDHKLLITMEGKAPTTKNIIVKSGIVNNVTLSLGATPPPVDVTPTVGVDTHEVKTTPVEPPTPAPVSPKRDNSVLGFSIAGGGGVVAVGAGVIASAAIYDRFFNRETCAKNVACVPKAPLLFGIYAAGCTPTSSGTSNPCSKRAEFNNDSGAWIGGSLAVVAVGALLITTGVVLAMSHDDAPSP